MVFSHNHCVWNAEDRAIRVGHCQFFFNLIPNNDFRKQKKPLQTLEGIDITAMWLLNSTNVEMRIIYQYIRLHLRFTPPVSALLKMTAFLTGNKLHNSKNVKLGIWKCESVWRDIFFKFYLYRLVGLKAFFTDSIMETQQVYI